MFLYSLAIQLWGLFQLIKLIVRTFKSIIWSNFVYHHYGCTSFFRTLSYPFRSLGNIFYQQIVVSLLVRHVYSYHLHCMIDSFPRILKLIVFFTPEVSKVSITIHFNIRRKLSLFNTMWYKIVFSMAENRFLSSGH